MVENSETHIITIFIFVISLVCVGAVVVMLVMPKSKKITQPGKQKDKQQEKSVESE